MGLLTTIHFIPSSEQSVAVTLNLYVVLIKDDTSGLLMNEPVVLLGTTMNVRSDGLEGLRANSEC